jgi:phage-related holin
MIKDFLIKNAFLFVPYLVFFLTPVAPMLILTGILVCTDLFTGIRAAKQRGEAITSKGFQRTVAKISLYFIAILLSRGMEVVFFDLPIARITAGYIALSEFKSNLENIGQYTGLDIWKNIVDKMQNLKK